MKRRGGKSRLITKLAVVPLFFLFFGGAFLSPSGVFAGEGDAAVAERYARWAKDKIDNGLWSEALAGLERASDFADISSDISYLLALARLHENKARGMVLEALDRSLAADRWNSYGPDAARLLKAEVLISVRAYQEALALLSGFPKSPGEAVLVLKALAASRRRDFSAYMSDTLDRFPRESGPVRVFFSYLEGEAAAGHKPGREDLQLLEIVLRRLPVLLLADEDLAWIAAPFTRDTPEAKRRVEAYRAAHEPAAASIPAALRLGVISEETALEELFRQLPEDEARNPAPHDEWKAAAERSLDMALLAEVWELLRYEGARELFRRNLLAYSGVITADEDRDGIPENSAEYRRGFLRFYSYDADQDGNPELTVIFEAGEPRRIRVTFPPESSRGLQTAELEWERYPALLEARLGGIRFIPRPLDFNYSPVLFDALFGSGLLFPRRDPLSPPLTRRALVSRVLFAERPSLEFKAGKETVELARGIPVAAREYIGEQIVSETEFLRGRPQLQRADLDIDGRMETVRIFRHTYRETELEDLWDYDLDIDYALSDWDGDGIYESKDYY